MLLSLPPLELVAGRAPVTFGGRRRQFLVARIALRRMRASALPLSRPIAVAVLHRSTPPLLTSAYDVSRPFLFLFIYFLISVLINQDTICVLINQDTMTNEACLQLF